MYVKKAVNQLILKYNTTCPFLLAKQLHIEIEFVNLGRKMLGFYTKNRRVPIITINESVDYMQQTFICAHELGHHELHPNINTPFLTKNTFYSIDKYEIEAHTFAIELLFANKKIITASDLEVYGIPKQIALLRKYG
ncbi:metallo-protease [Bacillus phage BCASJ1c]|uniref:4 protein n=1 Tax=Bacillus phage BCASJ1c TaxID=294382 RepID=Q5YAA5_9CAUD|nr:metallo-protease [Bacillus phage BCASJ1c]AAU85052.1 4 [Bacillus phage BCASJ1c] [Bacillus phage BCASJ1c]